MRPAIAPHTNTLKVIGSHHADYDAILTPAALAFLQKLVEEFATPLNSLLLDRKTYQAEIDAGKLPRFITSPSNQSNWKIKSIPKDLLDRRVEITGPVDRKMIINALNANVKVFMADFEDSLAPSWDNVIRGQINLRDAVNRTIHYTDPQTKKNYHLKENPAVLITRVRGLHLTEKNITYQNKAIPACLCDFSLYLFHNYHALLNQGSGPYFYLPKLQSHLEARWWHNMLCFAEDYLGLTRGTIKVTLLIETFPAVFAMDAILYELRDHIAGLNCGRWDYIFSFIKTLRNRSEFILPDRHLITMDKAFLNAYARLLIKTCHQRGALALGGMAAYIPSKDAQQNQLAFQKVSEDKQREASLGHDGTWIAHPGLADLAMSVFDNAFGSKRINQLDVSRHEDNIDVNALTTIPPGEITEAGFRQNIRIALQYLESWLGGMGCVPIYGLMEDAATAEISRASLWQWLHHEVVLNNGKFATSQLFKTILAEELQTFSTEFPHKNFLLAAKTLDKLVTQREFIDFITLETYQYLS